MKPKKNKECVCKVSEQKITCKECVQHVVKKKNARNCNMHAVKMHITTLEKKHEVKKSFVKKPFTKNHNKPFNKKIQAETVKCDCGNNIRIFKSNKEFKCFKCNKYHFKINNVWERQPHIIKRDTMTIAHLVEVGI